MTETQPFGAWPSPIDIETLFAASTEPMFPFRFGERFYWLQSLAEDGGRVSLMTLEGGTAIALTPAPFNIRTQVHEYGGKCFCLTDDAIIFNNFRDGSLYRQSLESAGGLSEPVRVFEAEESICGFADLVWLNGIVICVMERAEKGSENRNALVAIRVDGPSEDPQILAEGRDFYAAPVLNPAADRLAWLEWDHPHMPWDCTRLMSAGLSIADPPCLLDPVAVIDDPGATVSQPGFIDDQRLVFAMDDDVRDWSNLFVTDTEGVRQLSYEQGEIGEAHWVFGNQRWVQVSEKSLLAVCTHHGGDRLLHIELDDTTDPEVCFQDAALGQLWASNDGCVLITSSENRPSRILYLEPPFDRPAGPVPSSGPLLKSGYSKPRSLQFDTADGETVWAYYYPPYHPRITASKAQKPPLVVMIHGGPTARTNRAFHPLRQFFPTLGYAVLDVNHRGSTGYGRKYRQRLLGHWGEIDVADIITCVEGVVAEGLADPEAVFIRGGSAGGYAVLRALTRFPHTFAAGACYYGIGNLVTLAQITHKFESRYTDRLIGESYDAQHARQPQSRFYQRSPVNELDRLDSPLILFQGEDDKVVPPEVSREVAGMLQSQGITHAYHEYPGEGHGFRNTATRIDSLEKETKFFREILTPDLADHGK